MKRIVLATLCISPCLALAQSKPDMSTIAFSLKSPLEQFKSKQIASLSLSNTDLRLAPADTEPSSNMGRPLVIKTHALANLNFSKNDKIQYGLKMESDQFFDPFSFEKRLDTKFGYTPLQRVQTSAYVNYRFTPDYSLTASINRFTGVENARTFSVGARANKFFGRKHSLSTSFSLNWSKQASTPWSQFDRSLRATDGLSSNKFSTRPDLRLGVTWNWEINSNWSLSTGMSARHFLNDANKNPFNTQRSGVTIFSVANYRF
ncbi:MAG: DUF481 domain-containing protein [Burkholderiaceae bacterium]|nr:MAG: DUF481 domain-containing protein [Burkholderiaceae bacterium]